jgi:hypothetical protein
MGGRRDGRREKVRGVYGFSSLMKQKIKGKNYAVFCFAGFFFKKISVMKCLRSKKRKKALLFYYSHEPPLEALRGPRQASDHRSE